MIKDTYQRWIYIAADLVMSAAALVLFNIVRFYSFLDNEPYTLKEFLTAGPVLQGEIILPFVMLLIYMFSGCYYHVEFRSRVDELINSIYTTFIGAVLFFFFVVANDKVNDRNMVFEIIMTLWGLMFGCVYPVRLSLTLFFARGLHTRTAGQPTLIIGSTQAAVNLVDRLNRMSKSMGFNVVGYINVDDVDTTTPEHQHNLPVWSLSQLSDVIAEHKVRCLIIMPHPDGLHATMQLISKLFPLGLAMFVQPMLLQVISGRAQFGNVAGEPLIEISHPNISASTATIKRTVDIVGSMIALVLLSPILAAIAIAVKTDSPGPIFYRQERVGYRKRLFKIIKFRTMKVDAESNGPALSSLGDPRITRIGAFLRKYRLDELPQFVNVIRGDMSIVGPRPERPYYVERIIQRVPYYSLVHTVRPGITSWGMVKYGYASDIDQMIERLRYDLLYIENVSMGIDLKILIYTFKTVITGKGL